MASGSARRGPQLPRLGWDRRRLAVPAGLADSSHIFDDIAPEFVERYRVLGLARRGVGQSDKPPSGYENETLVEDIRQLLDALGIDRASLVGWSVGGNEVTGFAFQLLS